SLAPGVYQDDSFKRFNAEPIHRIVSMNSSDPNLTTSSMDYTPSNVHSYPDLNAGAHSGAINTQQKSEPQTSQNNASTSKQQSFNSTPQSVNGIRKSGMTREQLKFCNSILKELKRHRDAVPFIHPVDPVALKIPDYPLIIKNPMDLTTVEKKLNSVEYETFEDFGKDINLIFDNCYLYNGTESPVSLAATNLKNAYERLLRRMPKENAKPVTEPTAVKESPKKAPAASKPKKETIKKEEKKVPKLIPVQLVTPGSTANPMPLHIDRPRASSEERRPKRDIHAPSKEIPTGVSVKRKGSTRWKTDPQLRYCHSILRELSKKSNAEFMFPFMEPVDWEKLMIPDYPKIIKNPMDVGTIRQKLEADEYDSASQFEADIRLVMWNCFKFNAPDNPVHIMGRRMESLFNEKWADLPPPRTPTPPPMEEVAVDSEDESSDDVDSSDDKLAEMERHLKTLSEKIETMKATKKKEKGDKKPAAKLSQEKPKPKPPSKPPKSPTKVSEKKKSSKRSRPIYSSSEEDIPMITFEQKKELSDRINNFEGDKLANIVQIIHDSMPHLRDNGGQEEIELDMDSLDPKTLYKLYQFVKKNSPVKRKRPTPKKTKAPYSEDEKVTEVERTFHKFDQPTYGKGHIHGDYSSSSGGSSSESDSDDSESDLEPQISSPLRKSRSPIHVREKTPLSSSTSRPVNKRKKTETSSPPPVSQPAPTPPQARKPTHDKSWLNQSLTSKATMSFDVASLDLDVTEPSSKKTTGDSETYSRKRSDEVTQLENMEHWAAFTTDVQPVKASGPAPSKDGGNHKADPAWEQFQKEMKAKKEKVPV
ncbi:hypothetical protein BGZ49_003471, partial [Haplosporangium sp. Z 27]